MANKTAILSVKIVSDAKNFKRAMTQASNSVSKFQRSVGKATKVTAITTAIAGLASVALAGTSNLLALGVSLASIAPAALVLPGILAGMAVGLGVTIIALKDAGKYLEDLGPKFESLRASISENFWKKAAQPIREMVNTVLPRLSVGLNQTATAIGGFFASLAGVIKGALTPSVLASMFKPLVGSIEIAKGALKPFVAALITLGTVGGTYLEPLATWFVQISKDFNAFIQKAAKDGSLKGWIDTGLQALKDLGGVLAGLGGLFGGLGKAALAAGGAPLSALSDGLKRVNAAILQPAFQAGLTGLFKGAHDAMAGLGAGIGKVSGSFAQLFPVIGTALALFGNLAGSAISVVAPALVAILKAVMPVAEAVAGVLMSAFNQLSTWFTANQAKIHEFATAVGTTVVAAVQALSPLLTGLVTVLTSVGTWMINNKEAVIALGVAITAAVVTVNAIKVAMVAYTAVAAVMKTLQLAITTAMAAYRAGLTLATAAQIGMNVALSANPIGIVIVLVAALVAGIVYLATQTTFFQDTWRVMTEWVTKAWKATTKAITDGWRVVYSYISAKVQAIVVFFARAVADIKQKWNVAIMLIRGFITQLAASAIQKVNQIRQGFSVVINTIRNVWNAGFNFIRSIVYSVISGIASYINTIANVASRVISAVRNYFSSGFNAIRNLVYSVVNSIITTFNRVSNAVSQIVGWARNSFASAFYYMRNLAHNVINNIVGVFGRISGAVSNAMSWVRSLFNMGGMPGWLKGVLGMGGTGIEVNAFGPAQGLGIGSTGGLLGAPSGGTRIQPVVNNYHFTVNGALDPQAVAKQIKGLLKGDAQRTGRIAVGAELW